MWRCFLAAILAKESSFYYCDEHFSYIQSDIEQRIFGIMLDHIGDNEQLIFYHAQYRYAGSKSPEAQLCIPEKKAGGWKVSSFRYFSVGGAEKEYRLIEKCGGK